MDLDDRRDPRRSARLDFDFTDISRDGMLCGPSAAFYADLQGRFPTVEITVSGGISSMSDIEELDRQGLRSVIVGKALYEGRITLKDLARCLPNA